VAVDVSSQDGGHVKINGTVTLTGASDVTVLLESYIVSNGWRTIVTPSTIDFTTNGDAEQEFYCDVWVPHDAPFDESDIVQVNGTWEKFGVGGSIPSDQAVIDIKQFSGITIEPKYTYQDKELSSTIEFPLLFTNTGNGEDTFDLESIGLATDSGLGSILTLKYQEQKELVLEIDIPQVDNLEEYRITVAASSRIGSYTGTIEISAYIEDGRAFVVSHFGPLLIVRRGINLNTADIGNITIGDDKTVTVSVAAYLGTINDITFQLESDDTGFELIDAPQPFSLAPGQRVKYELKIHYESSNGTEEAVSPQRLIIIKAIGTSQDTNGEITSFNDLMLITVIREPKKTDSLLDSPYVAPVAGATAAGVIALVSLAVYASSETGKYKLLGLLFVPLYTKLHKDKILDHFARGRLYEYIKLNPGVTFTALKSELSMGNGTLTYHLKTLQREELIKSTKEGRNRCFYVTGTKVHSPGIEGDIQGPPRRDLPGPEDGKQPHQDDGEAGTYLAAPGREEQALLPGGSARGSLSLANSYYSSIYS